MMMSGQSAEQLRQHAQRAFEASDTLLRKAASKGGSSERFYRAANRYATTLRSLGGQALRRGGASGDDNNTGASTGLGGGAMSGADLTSVTLINHGVKEAIDSLQLKQMVRSMGEEGEAARALLDHARQMDSESQQAIQGLSNGVAGRSGASGSGTSGAGVGASGTTNAGSSDTGTSRGQQRETATSGREPGASSSPSAGTSGSETSGAGRSGGTGAGAAGAGASGSGGGQEGVAQMLAQQAQEVLQAIRELGGSSGEGSRSGRGASGSGREGAGAGNQEGRSQP